MGSRLGVKRSSAEVAGEKTDEVLVSEVLAGKRAAFADLALRHREQIERWCHRFFANREAVQDLAQESFIRIFAGLASYRPELPFRGWIRAIVVNVCYDELRRRQRRPEELVPDVGQAEQTWIHFVNEATPEALVKASQERAEAVSLAHRLLEALRPEDRIVMTLKESEELSVSEIAQVMGWSEAKVKIRVFRARQLMRRRAEQLLALGRNRVRR
ncbi:MAG TPA: sigma-70 family RNA polymerase sigma factor [Candidatus Binataceae bacterium]|nr:sigma-70 family RNA polymerase sigma factor [Candidatus Binataceae bacterium]